MPDYDFDELGADEISVGSVEIAEPYELLGPTDGIRNEFLRQAKLAFNVALGMSVLCFAAVITCISISLFLPGLDTMWKVISVLTGTGSTSLSGVVTYLFFKRSDAANRKLADMHDLLESLILIQQIKNPETRNVQLVRLIAKWSGTKPSIASRPLGKNALTTK